MVPAKVLSLAPLGKGLIRVKVETESSPSMDFGDGGCVLEIICKSYREFSSYPHHRDGGGGGGHHTDIDPKPPAHLKLVKA
jgi:hypothetical protein